MNEYDLINAYLNLIFDDSITYFSRILDEYRGLCQLRKWMRKRGINLKAIENIGYDMFLAFSKAKNAEQIMEKMDPTHLEELKEYISHLYGIMADERMFRFTKSYMEHEIIRGIKASGVKRIRLHDIRHSHISLLIDIGFSAVAASLVDAPVLAHPVRARTPRPRASVTAANFFIEMPPLHSD